MLSSGFFFLLLPPIVSALCVALGTARMVEPMLHAEPAVLPVAAALCLLCLAGRLPWLAGACAALLAAWAAAKACCDPLMRAADERPLVPRSLFAGFDGIEAPHQCDILTPYAAVGRRAVVVCCALSLGAGGYASSGGGLLNAWRGVALGALFAAIVCNEAAWDWRALCAPVIAGVVCCALHR